MGLFNTYASRLKADFRKTFDSENGRHVLVHLYEKCNGGRTSITQDFDPIKLAFNEGKRWTLLMILEQLKEDDHAMRELLRRHNEERIREEAA